jgi:hypothetical protein
MKNFPLEQTALGKLVIISISNLGTEVFKNYFISPMYQKKW